MSATEIKIGYWVVNSDAGCQAIGADRGSGQGCTSSDADAVRAFASHVNANGGIVGRKLVPVIYETEATRDSWASQAQAACAHFTEDNQVFAVVSEGEVGRDVLAYCVARTNTPVIDPGFWPFDDHAYRELNGLLYQPDRAKPERWVRAYIDGLAAQGFFGKDTRVGLFRFGGGSFDRVTERVLKAKLQEHGVKLAEEAVIKTPASVAAFSDMNVELASAILRFRQARVNRVIFFSTMAEMAIFYFPQAESQGFRPRYGVSSLEYLGRLSADAPDAQLRDAVGVGWLPRFDVAPADDPGGSAAAAQCKEILRQAGLNAGAGRNSRCSATLFLKAALDRAPALNPTGLRLAVEGLGTSFEPAETFTASFGPGRYDGPSTLRFVGFNTQCGCFRYTSGPKPLP